MVGPADGWQSYFIDSLFLLSLFCFYFHLFTCLLIEERRIIGSKSGNCDSSISLSISFFLFPLLFLLIMERRMVWWQESDAWQL